MSFKKNQHNRAFSHSTDENSLTDLLTQLQGATNWYNLGIALGLTHSRLDEIKIDNRENVNACRREMLHAWLRKTDHVVQPPSWRTLAVALVDPLVNYTEIARIIARLHS